MAKRFASALFVVTLTFVYGLEASAQTRVGGYTRRDGTHVQPYYRSRPDGNFSNNWSTKGNVNPYTGKPGTRVTPPSSRSVTGSIPNSEGNGTHDTSPMSPSGDRAPSEVGVDPPRSNPQKRRTPTSEDYLTYGLTLGYSNDAIPYFEEAIRLDPASVKAYGNRGTVQYFFREYEQAAQSFSQVIQLAPNNAAGHINRSIVNCTLKQFARSIEDCNRAIALDPKAADAYISRGVSYGVLGDLNRSIHDYEQAIDLGPNADAYYNRGVTLSALGHHQQSVQDYSESIKLRPEYWQAYANRGVVYGILRHPSLEIQDYDQALYRISCDGICTSKREILLFKRATAKQLSGDFDGAGSDFGAARRIDPAIDRCRDEIYSQPLVIPRPIRF